MIKGILGYRDGDPRKAVIFLGLSNRNVEKLSLKQPLLVKLEELEPSLPPIHFVLATGDTEEAILQDMRDAGMKIGRFIDEKTPREQQLREQGVDPDE